MPECLSARVSGVFGFQAFLETTFAADYRSWVVSVHQLAAEASNRLFQEGPAYGSEAGSQLRDQACHRCQGTLCIRHCVWGSAQENRSHKECAVIGSTLADCPHEPKCVFVVSPTRADRI